MIIEEYLLIVAKAVASRSKCRRQVGCVLADKDGRILSTGYNGFPSGMKNCTIETCTNYPGSHIPCNTIHAEINSVLYCERPRDVYYVACTRLPCVTCAMVLLNLPGKVLIYEENNSHPGTQELLENKYVLCLLNLSPKD